MSKTILVSSRDKLSPLREVGNAQRVTILERCTTHTIFSTFLKILYLLYNFGDDGEQNYNRQENHPIFYFILMVILQKRALCISKSPTEGSSPIPKN